MTRLSAHVNPVRTVGDFLAEAMLSNLGIRPAAAHDYFVDALDTVLGELTWWSGPHGLP